MVFLSMTKMPRTLNPIGSPCKRSRNRFIYNAVLVSYTYTITKTQSILTNTSSDAKLLVHIDYNEDKITYASKPTVASIYKGSPNGSPNTDTVWPTQ